MTRQDFGCIIRAPSELDGLDYVLVIRGYEAFPEARCSALEQGMQAHLRRRRLVIKGRAV